MPELRADLASLKAASTTAWPASTAGPVSCPRSSRMSRSSIESSFFKGFYDPGSQTEFPSIPHRNIALLISGPQRRSSNRLGVGGVRKPMPKPLRTHSRKWHASVTPAAAAPARLRTCQANKAIFRCGDDGVRIGAPSLRKPPRRWVSDSVCSSSTTHPAGLFPTRGVVC
jgi:hypothetical protein